MYERDMSDTEIIIQQLNTLIDLTQEIVDNLEMILQNQNKDEICARIGCDHPIDFHKLFKGCQVSECECEQFYRKEKNA